MVDKDDLEFIATYLLGKIEEVCEKKYREIEQRNHKDNKIAMLECPAVKVVTSIFHDPEKVEEFRTLMGEVKQHLDEHTKFRRFLVSMGAAFVTCLIGNIVTLIILYARSKALGKLP